MSMHPVADSREIHANHSDLDGARAWMASICGPHWLKATAPQRLQFHHCASRLKSMGTVLGCIEYGTDVTVGVEDSVRLNSYSISLPVSGEQELTKSAERYLSNNQHGLIVSPDENQELIIAGNCRKLLVAINRQSMRACLEELLQARTEEPLRFEPLMDASQGAGASWWRSARHLLAEMNHCQPLYGHASYARDMESAFIKGLILSQPNNYTQLLMRAQETKIPHYLLRARAMIEERAGEDLHLEDIEAVAGVSRVKLFEGFKRYYDTTPMACLKRYRLEAVRRAIMSEPCARRISVIAMNWGFTHLGRFSSEYKKLFGETPSATAQQHKNIDV